MGISGFSSLGSSFQISWETRNAWKNHLQMLYCLSFTSVQCPCVLLCAGPFPLCAGSAAPETPKEQTKVSLSAKQAGWGFSEPQPGCRAGKWWQLFPNTHKVAWIIFTVILARFFFLPQKCVLCNIRSQLFVEDMWLQQKDIQNHVYLHSGALLRLCELVFRQSLCLSVGRVSQVRGFG